MRKTIAAAISATAAVALASGGGLALASTHGAAARPAVTGTEHFQLMSTNGNSNRSQAITYGVFTAAGVDISGKGNTDLVKFPGGSFKLTHRQTSGTQHMNPATCLGIFTGRATYTISHGTGRYAGVHGSGKATLSFLGIAARGSNGRCNPNKTVAAQLIIQGSGPLSLP